MTIATGTTAPAIDWGAPFEELAEGATFATRARTITEADVVGFAALSGDWHPLHTDAVWAQQGPFGRRIAHGLLVVSVAAGLLPLDPLRVVALRGVRDVTFKRPVALGATISVHGAVASLRPASPQAGLVGLAWSVTDEHGHLMCRASVDLIWSRDDAPADDRPEPVPF